MEQPRVYNNEIELINWLKKDIKEQRKKISLLKRIPLKKVDERDLTLNIGIRYSDIINDSKFIDDKIEINFRFNLNNILYKLFNNYNNTYYEINCRKVIFNKKVYFSNVSFNNKIIFIDNKFIDKAYFYNNSFNDKVYFFMNLFNNRISFDNTLFSDKVYFSKNIFNKKFIFSKVIFERIKFSGIFLGNIKFLNITVNDYFNFHDLYVSNDIEILFDKIKFKNNNSNLYINNAPIRINKLSFKNVFINGIINIQNVEVEIADFKGSVTNGGLVNPVNFKIDNFANRESALFLKNEAYARRNAIDALEYKAKEIEMHKKELLNKQNKTLKDWFDIISISLSSLYSNNGQNWGQSFLYTLIIPSIFFTISYIPSNVSYFSYILFLSYLFIRFKCKDIVKYILTSIFAYIVFCGFLPTFYLYGLNKLLNINFFKELLRFLTPTNFEAITNINDKETISYIYQNNNIVETIIKSLSYFLGKIAFWYGSVQTVQAFRKFSKGA